MYLFVKFKTKPSMTKFKYQRALVRFLKTTAPTVAITWFGYFLYELQATTETIGKIVDRKALSNERKSVQYIYINISDIAGKRKKVKLNRQGGYLQPHEKFPWLSHWWQRQKYILRWKIMAMASSGYLRDRWRSVEILSKLSLDSESDFVQLAQACDAATAVGLARSKNVDLRFFLPPRGLLMTKNKEAIVGRLRDLLFDLNEKSEHLCIKHFLSKAFPYFQEEYTNLDYSQLMPMEDTRTINISDENILPMSVKSLVHHCSIRDNAKEMVLKGGLALLLDVYKLAENNKEIQLMLGRLMTYVSRYPELLEQVFMSGWLGVLAKWVQDKDKSISVPATQCLANFDLDDPLNARYGRRVFPLYPTTRSMPPKVDVVFIHGLLGGLLFTWRQRNTVHSEKPLSFFDITGNSVTENSKTSTSDTKTQAYFSAMSELLASERDEIGSDFEFVLTDLPVETNMANTQPFTLSGKNQNVRQFGEDQSYTTCWPQDWLPQDCPSIRVLGINYDSRLSDWLAVCPKKMMAQTLEYRSKVLLEQLKASGIGQRPVIWITHSMGGLLVKKMLVNASNSDQKVLKNIAENTKGIVFMGTPHKGSHLANINEILKRIILPSSEVEDLKHNSPMLTELHDHFLEYLDHVPVKVVSFAETKSTMLSSLRIEVHLVPSDIAYPGTGEMYELPYDHACLSKPQHRLSFIYQKVLSVVRSIVNEVR